MGSAGMKRKGRRHLPKVEGDLGPDDTARLFGRFRWNAFSPAGTVERFGFLTRQMNRRGSRDGFRWGFGAVRIVAPIFGCVLITMWLVRLFT